MSRNVTTTWSDANDRRRALNVEASFIVQAPAGSGKTTLLVKRYLALLARVPEPEEIVAITFTNKAAAEMRERVLLALRGEVDANKDAELAELAQQAREQNMRCGWDISRQTGRIKIQTIDSLNTSLVRRLPWTSGTGNAFRVPDQPQIAYREVAQTLLSYAGGKNEWAKPVNELIQHLNGDVDRMINMLVRLLGKRDQWLRYVLSFSADENLEDNNSVVRRMLETSWSVAIKNSLEQVANAWPLHIADDLLASMQFAGKHLEGVKDDLLMPLVDVQRLPVASVDDTLLWKAVAELLLKRDQSNVSWRGSLNKNQGFPAGAKGSNKEAKECLLQVIGQCEPNIHLLSALNNIRSLPQSGLDDAEWRVLQNLFEILRLAVAELHLLFKKTGETDFVELSSQASAALGTEDAPTEIALLMDYRVQHLLVDEFQDTSISQLDLLRRLTMNWSIDEREAGGSPRTFFAVGDPMQSIYRFREAEVGVFLDVAEHGLGIVDTEPLRLAKNFRSNQVIVDWLNDSLAQTFPELSDRYSGAVTYANAETVNTEPEGGVHIHAFADDNGTAEAQRMVEIVRREQAGKEGAEIAILVRSRAHLACVIGAFNRAGVRYQGVKIDPLLAYAEVQDVYALLRALLHPGDRLAWFSILRAPWCGLTLEDMTLAFADKKQTVLAQIELALAQDDLLPEQSYKRLDRFHDAMRMALTQNQRLPLRVWLEHTWRQLGGHIAARPGNHRHVDTFFELLEKHEQGGSIVSVKAFDIALHNAYAIPQSSDPECVQLMTIHAAKGLEFDCVILPSLHKTGRNQDSEILLWSEMAPSHNNPSVQDRLLLAPIKPPHQKSSAKYDFLKRLEKTKQDNELVRLLYVAASRAKCSLHLLGSVKTDDDDGQIKKPAKGSMLHNLWSVVQTSFESVSSDAAKAQVDTFALTQAQPRKLRRLIADWKPDKNYFERLQQITSVTDAAEDQEHLNFDWAGRRARIVGSTVHETLKNATLETIKTFANDIFSKQKISARLRAYGLTGTLLESALARVHRAMINISEDEKGIWLFDEKHTDVRNEWPLSGVVNDELVSGVLDKSFIDENDVRWIVDFKTGEHKGGSVEKFLDEEQLRYSDQLERYAVLISGVESREIRLGLYFPMLKQWREWAPRANRA
ncbi:MAG: UvrD-helicase domain-containing protein [Arenicellales bacterium WSBS_2016_MAG_OTU3]